MNLEQAVEILSKTPVLDSAHAICTKANAGNVKAVRKREAAKRRGK